MCAIVMCEHSLVIVPNAMLERNWEYMDPKTLLNDCAMFEMMLVVGDEGT